MRRGMTGAKTYLRCLRTPPGCETAARGTERTPLGPAAATSPTDPPEARVRPRAVRDKRSARVLSGERELAQRAFGLPYPVPRSEVGVGGRRTRLAFTPFRWHGDRHPTLSGPARGRRGARSISPSSAP